MSETMPSFMLRTFTEGCRAIFKINTVTNKINIYKLKGELYPTPEIPISGYDFVNELLSQKTIYEEDLWQFEYLKLPDVFIHRYLHDPNGSVMAYRRWEGDRLIWVRTTMMFPNDYSPEHPEILVFSVDLTSAESDFMESCFLLSEHFHKVAKFNLTTNHSSHIKEYPSEEIARTKIGIEAFLEEANFIQKNYVHPDDESVYAKYIAPSSIMEYFHSGKENYQCFYRRRVGSLFRWVRLTIVPTSDYTPHTNESFFFFVEDFHQNILKLIDTEAFIDFSKFYEKLDPNISVSFYENIMQVLHYLTESYVDYYMLDLEHDLYLRYKLRSGLLRESFPYVGEYSKISSAFIRSHYQGAEAERMLQYSTSEKLKKLLADKLSIEYNHFDEKGVEYKTTVVKLESKKNIPTKALVSVVVCPPKNVLVVKTFGNFELSRVDGTPVKISRGQTRELLAYLIDKNGFPVGSKDIVMDLLEKSPDDIAAIKYVSTMVKRAMDDLKEAGFPNVILKEGKSIRVNTNAVDCDYYHLLMGDPSYLLRYHNEYMKEYSWAEDTNAELLQLNDR